MRLTKAEKAAEKAKADARYAEASRIVASGKCPLCGDGLRRNLSLTGWWQCQQLGVWRKDPSKPSCSFQLFMER